MSSDPEKMIHRIYEEAYNKGNLDVLDEAIDEDYLRHQPPMPDVQGLEAYKKFIADSRNAYSGLEFSIEQIIVQGDTSAARYTLRGIHTGHSPTIRAQPTGNPVIMPGCIISHWVNGKVAVDWAYNDYLGLLQQFGVYPPPGMFA